MEVENNDELIVKENKNTNKDILTEKGKENIEMEKEKEKEKDMEIEIERNKRKRRFKPFAANQKRRIESPPIVVSAKKKENN